MSKGAHDVFVLVRNFLKKNWILKHITIGLLEMFEHQGKHWQKVCKTFMSNMA
jgi:hypothetical protein